VPFCWYCGEEIEFRWIDGGPKPIHLSGSWCTGYASEGGAVSPPPLSPRPSPPTRASARWSVGHARCDLGVPLTHPTTCPICGAFIFFHTNGNGDCVFFDELGPPWPKHACLSNDDGVRVASRSPELMRLVDLVAPPTHISPPQGSSINEFDEQKLGHVVTGVVLSVKEKKVWRSQPGTAIRQPTKVLAIVLQLGSRELLRVYTPVGVRMQVGLVVQLVAREEAFDGRSVLYAESGLAVVPPGSSVG